MAISDCFANKTGPYLLARDCTVRRLFFGAGLERAGTMKVLVFIWSVVVPECVQGDFS